MKFSIAVIAVLAGAVVNAQFPGPQCAQECISKTLSEIAMSGCKMSDIACICRNDAFINTVGTCVKDACSPQDYQTTLESAVGFCKAVGVDVNTNIATAMPTQTGSMTAQPSATSNTTVIGGGNGANQTQTNTAGGPEATGNDKGSANGLKAVGWGIVGGLVAAVVAL